MTTFLGASQVLHQQLCSPQPDDFLYSSHPSSEALPSWNPPSLLKKGGGVGPSKNLVTWGVPNILLERWGKPEKVATFSLLYSSIAFTVGGEKRKVTFITF